MDQSEDSARGGVGVTPGSPQSEPERVIAFRGATVTIGRSNSNDIVLDDVNVSRFHAELVQNGDLVELRDLDSSCGTRLDGRPAKRAVVRDGGRIGIGPYELVFDGSAVVSRNQRGALTLEAIGVGHAVDGKRILEPLSLGVGPGELVAVIGESGSGKTTLIRALAGVRQPTDGVVTLNGEPVTARLTDTGYVPQHEIVHRLLTVREALEYQAQLRLPADHEPGAVRSTIERVLVELALEPHADTRIGDLSGGQRKRAAMASELLGRPSLLFLDEPTTGLDPMLESQMMQLFRDLAEPGARAVVLVTHATRNLALCDKVAVLARGGRLAFFGTPDEAKRFFGVESFDEIYEALSRRPSEEWAQAYQRQAPQPRAPGPDGAPAPGPSGSPRAQRSAGRQFAVLTGRYAKLLGRDGRNLAILLGQVPVIAFLVALLFKRHLFDLVGVGFDPKPGNPGEQIALLFLISTSCLWLGAIDSARELVKERDIADREAAIGVGFGAYFASKIVVLFSLAAVQAIALTAIVLAFHPLQEGPSAYLALTALMVLTAWVAVALGLAISAAVNNQDQAASFIPLALIPQLLLAGAVVPVFRMAEPLATVAGAAFSRWSLAGAGSSVDMNQRMAEDTKYNTFASYGGEFFDVRVGACVGALLVFLLLFAGLAALLELGKRRARRG